MQLSSTIIQGLVPLGMGFGMLATGVAVAWGYRRRCKLLESELRLVRAQEAAARAELAGKAEEGAQFRRLFETSPAPLLVLSMDGRVLRANEAACALHGQPLEQLTADGGGVPVDMQEAVPGELERLGRPGGGLVETLRIGAGSRMIPVELCGRPIEFGGGKAILVHELDLTTSKRQEASLREGQERYRALVGALSEGVLLVDSEGRIATANVSAERILGLVAGEIVGTDLMTAPLKRVRIDGTEMPPSESPVAKTLRTGEAQRDVVLGIHGSTVPKRWLSVTTTPLKRNLTGKVLTLVVSFADITQQVEAQRELVRAKEAAESANQAKTEFLAHISHEIRTPLNGLTSSHDLLLNSSLTEEQRGCVQTAVQLVEDMLTLLNDLLDLAKIDAGRLEIVREAFELRPMLEASLRSFRPRVRRAGLDLTLEIDERLPVWVLGDAHRLRQVLANLVSNAVKFTQAGSIRVQVHPMDSERVRIVVADTGIGIAPDKLSLIFEAFRQADVSISRRFGGTGLGLAICRQLVGLLQGRIWVESELGHGSRFYFEVPLPLASAPDSTGAAVAVAASSAPLEIPFRPAARVLIVEDHPVNRQLTETMVQKMGVATAVASNGREALDRLERESFSLVLMDVQMPEMDGLTATRAWRAREAELGRPRTTIVALTAHALPQDKAACLDSGMDDYMCKPLRRELLSEMLTRHLSGKAVGRPIAETSVGTSRAAGDTSIATRKLGAGLSPSMLVMLRDANRDGLGRLRAAIRASDGLEAAKSLHFVKGGCALLQDEDLTNFLKSLEIESKAGRLARVSEQLPELESRIEAVMRRAEMAGA